MNITTPPTEHRPYCGSMYTTDENADSMDLDDLVGYPPTGTKKDDWVEELQSLLENEYLTQRADSGAHEIAVGPSLSWPVDATCELDGINSADQKQAIALVDEAYDIEYGTDERVLALLCDETIVDIRLGIWRADRFLALKQRVVEYFELYNSRLFNEVVCTAERLIQDHDECETICDPQIYTIFRTSMEFLKKTGMHEPLV
jgi:hypothetical protein